MQRRSFLQLMTASSLSASYIPNINAATSSAYNGPIFICISCEGGWDVTSFCDPKTSYTNEDNHQVWVNNWANPNNPNFSNIQSVTNSEIKYAPFALNSELFTNHGDKMLIVNGIDAQTNAHQVGVRHNWSGQIADGYPSFTALAARIYGQGLPLAFLSNGGYRQTAGLIPFTLMSNPNTLGSLVNTNRPTYIGPQNLTRPGEMDLIQSAKSARFNRLEANDLLLPKTKHSLIQMQAAIAARSQLSALEAHIPETLINANTYGTYNPLLPQAQMVLASAKAGLTVSADLVLGGFDTHATHDEEHSIALTNLTQGINYLWEEAERLGIADRLRVFMTSDFSRTPQYNEGDGKDHWPIGSAMFMQKSPTWSTQVIGKTDEKHLALSLNSNLSVADDQETGIIIEPRHVQHALRHWAGINNDAEGICAQFDLGADDLDLTQVFV
ncbi:DUF1501 domain-containing protein [Marinicellulosiphila megalodicopiae]|uniref:DUF1501 domain-containing protein n=1 Tax=Marinicellulosiphila megalodicopiae TaxID=2724896 RepID=UPI003BB126DC